MPFPFTLPTTSSFSFSTYFESSSHPSLPLSASTYRGVLKNVLKKHKRLPPTDQSSHLATILLALNNYIPYLLAVDSGLASQTVSGEEVDVILKSTPDSEWRPTLTDTAITRREAARLNIQSLEYEIYFVLSTLAYTYILLSRTSLQPLYSSASASPTAEQRTTAIQTATKQLLLSGSIHEYLASRSETISSTPPCVDITNSTFSALKSLALAEATLLAVLKDDPYPAAVAQDRNKNDREWMIKAPEMPKVRAHLFARLCLAAAEHAANALSLLSAGGKVGKVDGELLRYVEDLKRTGRGKACRFLGIDADLGGQTGTGIAWLKAGKYELGLGKNEEGKGSSLSKFKKDWIEKREEKRVEKGASWGSDAGKAEEGRVLEMLEKQWVKMNDTINTQIIPSTGPLMASMPSGRDIHSLKPFKPLVLDSSILERMRAPPDRSDDYGGEGSSDEERGAQDPVGAFPGTKDAYAGSGSSNYY